MYHVDILAANFLDLCSEVLWFHHCLSIIRLSICSQFFSGTTHYFLLIFCVKLDLCNNGHKKRLKKNPKNRFFLKIAFFKYKSILNTKAFIFAQKLQIMQLFSCKNVKFLVTLSLWNFLLLSYWPKCSWPYRF